MSPPTELLDRVLALPVEQRADLARHLLLSLEAEPFDDPAEADQAWSDEIDARIARADAGESAEVDWRVALERVRNSLSKPKG
jgi:hypothetical protein